MTTSPTSLAQAQQSRQQQRVHATYASLSVKSLGCPAWQFTAEMPQEVEAAAATSDGTYAYVVGGFAINFGDVNAFGRYDPTTDTWTSLAPMPVPAAMASAVYYPPTHRIYVFGGQRFSDSVTFEVTRIYDIASNTWSAGASMPDVRGFMASGYNSANGKIYLVSGYNASDLASAQADTWEYDPVRNTFAARAPFPHPVGGAASGIINGHMFVAGGWDANDVVVNLLWDYDIASDVWTQRASMPCGQQNIPGSAVALGKLWVFGGGNPFRFNNSHSTIPPLRQEKRKGEPLTPDTTNFGRVYDPQTNTWGYGRDMNAIRSFPAATAIGSKLFAAGGYDFLSLSSAEIVDACVTDPNPVALPDYSVTISSGVAIEPGTTDIGNHCDDCTTPISFPFPVQFYDQVFTTANVSPHGLLEFTSLDPACCGACFPQHAVSGGVIAPHWSFLNTSDGANGLGIFTSVSGTTPNRIFNIEWRAVYCCGGGPPTENFEVRLYENENRIDFIYGTLATTLPFGSGFSIGVQREIDGCHYSVISCDMVPAVGTQYRLTLPSTPMVISAVSRKTHAGSGDFDIVLPLTGNVGVECRSGGATNDYKMAVTFGNSVAVMGSPQAQVTSGSGSIGSTGVSNGGTVEVAGTLVTIPLTNVINAQKIKVTLHGVSDGVNNGDVVIPMGVLVGDTTGDGSVNATDVSQTKLQSGQAVTGSNFRNDITVNGSINATDVSSVKLKSGTGLP